MTRAIRVLGIDPGADSGIAILELDGSRAHRVRSWPTRMVLLDLVRVLESANQGCSESRIDLVAIETIVGYAHGERAHAKSAALIATSRLEGELAGTARAMGFTVLSVPATTWRRALIGHPQASDKRIKAMLLPRLTNPPAQSRNHERDAIGTALYGAMTMQRGRAA